ncbi:MAG: heme-binding domain-containing protein [Sulfurimonas sp.]|nr:heme-binding domain-containing protein [Sulfurimonas sp.]MDD3835749.1 heme-binding domain-containing protein [Sulfurimonas sp.]
MKKTIFTFVALLLLLQFIPVEKTNPPIDSKLTLNAETKVMEVLKKSCYDCHSNETKWPLYASIAPFSFFVASHVNDGRKALNFSNYNNIDSKTKEKRLKRAITTIKNERMALPSYRFAHESANLSKEENELLIAWLEEEISMLRN